MYAAHKLRDSAHTSGGLIFRTFLFAMLRSSLITYNHNKYALSGPVDNRKYVSAVSAVKIGPDI